MADFQYRDGAKLWRLYGQEHAIGGKKLRVGSQEAGVDK